jgi:hypothetical protein
MGGSVIGLTDAYSLASLPTDVTCRWMFRPVETHAKRAIEAASLKKSGFRYHSDLGLVDEKYDGVLADLHKIAH